MGICQHETTICYVSADTRHNVLGLSHEMETQCVRDWLL